MRAAHAVRVARVVHTASAKRAVHALRAARFFYFNNWLLCFGFLSNLVSFVVAFFSSLLCLTRIVAHSVDFIIMVPT